MAPGLRHRPPPDVKLWVRERCPAEPSKESNLESVQRESNKEPGFYKDPVVSGWEIRIKRKLTLSEKKRKGEKVS